MVGSIWTVRLRSNGHDRLVAFFFGETEDRGGAWAADGGGSPELHRRRDRLMEVDGALGDSDEGRSGRRAPRPDLPEGQRRWPAVIHGGHGSRSSSREVLGYAELQINMGKTILGA